MEEVLEPGPGPGYGQWAAAFLPVARGRAGEDEAAEGRESEGRDKPFQGAQVHLKTPTVHWADSTLGRRVAGRLPG